MVEGAWQTRGLALVSASGEGRALVLDEPLSFWGGLDLGSGQIVDQRHPQRGQSLTGMVLVMPAGRGSSSSSSVLAEAIRTGVGPAAIMLAANDEIVVLGALVVGLLYGPTCPVVVLEPADYGRVRADDLVSIDEAGMVVVIPAKGGRALT
jgi:uncharacterized protein